MEKLGCWATVRPAFVQDVKRKKKDIQVMRIVKDVMNKKVNKFLISLQLSMSKMWVMKVVKKTFFFVSSDRVQKFFDQKELRRKCLFQFSIQLLNHSNLTIKT